MAKTLANLVSELQSEVPAVNSVPTTAQYQQAIKDAALEFSRRCGQAKWAELTVVSGTPTYDLAADFLGLISLEMMVGVDGVMVSNTGLIPVSADWEEEYTIRNKQITFTPTPTYSLTRDYKYKAGWILTGTTGSETFAEMGDDEAQIVLIKAKSLAIEKRANALASSGGMKYSLGAVSVDKGGGVDSLSKMVYTLHGDFVAACDRYNGAFITC
jgi:hypothetical protein